MIVLVEIALWLPYDPDKAPLRGLLAAVIVIVGASSYLRWRRSGGRSHEPIVDRRGAWIEAALATLIIAAVVLVWLALAREPYEDSDLAFLGTAPAFLTWTGRRLAMAALQQIFLQIFFYLEVFISFFCHLFAEGHRHCCHCRPSAAPWRGCWRRPSVSLNRCRARG